MKSVKVYILIDPIKLDVRYVGITTKRLKVRLWGHISSANCKTSNNYKNNWIISLKKGGSVPIIEEIDEVLMDEWQFWEQHYISLYKSWGFKLTNLTFGGEGTFGYKFSEECKLKMSKIQKGKPNLKAVKYLSVKVCKLDLKGNYICEYSSLREAERNEQVTSGDISMSCRNTNRTVAGFSWCYKSDLKNRVNFLKSNNVIYGNTRKVDQFTKDGVFIKRWESISEAARELKTHVTSISALCNKKPQRVTVVGYKWEYV